MLAVPFLRVLVKIAGAEKELVEIGIFHTCGQTEFPDLFPETSGSVCERTEEGANHAAIGVFPIKDFTIGAIAGRGRNRSEEHTSELQSLMRISYAVSSLKTNNNHY